VVSIAAVTAGDATGQEASRLLLNRLLGAGLYSPDRIADAARDDGESLLLAALDGSAVVGAGLCRLLYPDDADYYHAFGAPALELFGRHQVGSLEALAVEPTRQRQGIGKRLTQAQLDWLAHHGRDVAVAVSWISGGVSASGPLYERLGFSGSAPVADFYLEESVAEGWTCPYCLGPCHCAGALYQRRLP
jgi:GNAT superfamily N-acetyltransferase